MRADRQKPSSRRSLNAMMVCGGAALFALVLLLSAAVPTGVGESLTRNTVRLSLAWYAAALLAMMRLTRVDWTADTLRGVAARWCWTWGGLVFVVHLAMAFHYYHQWSHTHAFEHTREVSGVGEGIYVSYLFILLWLADIGWWWASPLTYAQRSPWVDRALHAFMLFIVFNGMVVFETGAIRWVGLIAFPLLAAYWLSARRRVAIGHG